MTRRLEPERKIVNSFKSYFLFGSEKQLACTSHAENGQEKRIAYISNAHSAQSVLKAQTAPDNAA